MSLQKHAYSNILKISPSKIEKIQIKRSGIFHISLQNTDCGHSLEPPLRGSSNEYPQSMFLSIDKKNHAYPCKPQFYYIKGGLRGVKIIQVCFRDVIFPEYLHLYFVYVSHFFFFFFFFFCIFTFEPRLKIW